MKKALISPILPSNSINFKSHKQPLSLPHANHMRHRYISVDQQKHDLSHKKPRTHTCLSTQKLNSILPPTTDTTTTMTTKMKFKKNITHIAQAKAKAPDTLNNIIIIMRITLVLSNVCMQRSWKCICVKVCDLCLVDKERVCVCGLSWYFGGHIMLLLGLEKQRRGEMWVLHAYAHQHNRQKSKWKRARQLIFGVSLCMWSAQEEKNEGIVSGMLLLVQRDVTWIYRTTFWTNMNDFFSIAGSRLLFKEANVRGGRGDRMQYVFG